jgi:hypothetical protein
LWEVWKIVCSDIVYEDKYIRISVIEKLKRTNVFNVESKYSNDSLGQIRWYPQWRHYCFMPETKYKTLLSDRCLLAISEFIVNRKGVMKRAIP